MSNIIEEENPLTIDLSACPPAITKNMAEKSITRDLGERLVFVQMKRITKGNVGEYFARLNLLAEVYDQFELLTSQIFSDATPPEHVGNYGLLPTDFVSRIGIVTNLKHDTTRNFLDRIAEHLKQLEQKGVAANKLTYNDLLKIYEDYKYIFQKFFSEDVIDLYGEITDYGFDYISQFLEARNYVPYKPVTGIPVVVSESLGWTNIESSEIEGDENEHI